MKMPTLTASIFITLRMGFVRRQVVDQEIELPTH